MEGRKRNERGERLEIDQGRKGGACVNRIGEGGTEGEKGRKEDEAERTAGKGEERAITGGEQRGKRGFQKGWRE